MSRSCLLQQLNHYTTLKKEFESSLLKRWNYILLNNYCGNKEGHIGSALFCQVMKKNSRCSFCCRSREGDQSQLRLHCLYLEVIVSYREMMCVLKQAVMKQLNTYLTVSERDVDLLILEEFIVSDSFSNWFVTTALGQSITVSTVGAWHSVSDPVLGESDLVYLYRPDSEETQAFLIENKIGAEAQPDQSIRYQQRGVKGVELGYWSGFQTCIIAPKNYLENNDQVYDCEISYEQIVDYLCGQSDARSIYRATFLKEAIEKNRRGYQACISENMTVFAEKYLSFVALNYPELNPEKPKPRAAGHTWIHFYPLIHDSNTRIVHQIYGNKVKIIYLGQADRYYEISDKFGQVKDRKYAVKRSGKSVTVEVNCPDINPLTQNFEDVFEQISEAIALALDLKLRLY